MVQICRYIGQNNLQNHESSDKHELIVGPNLSLNLPRLDGIKKKFTIDTSPSVERRQSMVVSGIVISEFWLIQWREQTSKDFSVVV